MRNNDKKMTLIVDMRINKIPEWIAYKNNPSPDTLSEFIKACRKQRLEENVILHSFYIEYLNTGNWKIAQHLSLLLEKQITYAYYFAYKALRKSDGNVFARLLFAKILWLRRLPLAVIHETTIIRHQLKKIKNKDRKLMGLSEVAKLNIMVFSYLQDMKSTKKWFQYLNKIKDVPTEDEVYLQILLGSIHSRDHSLAWIAAQALVPHTNTFGKRIQCIILNEIKIALINALKNISTRKSQNESY